MIPDSPYKPNPWAFWFKEKHAEFSRLRLERTNRVDSKPITWASALYVMNTHTIESIANTLERRTFSGWIVYVIAILYISMVLGTSGYNYFGLFLKSILNSDGTRRWTTSEVNLIPIGGSAINVVFGKTESSTV